MHQLVNKRLWWYQDARCNNKKNSLSLTYDTILRRTDVNVFHIFAAALCEFEIIKLSLFAQGDGRYVLSTIFKVMDIKRFNAAYIFHSWVTSANYLQESRTPHQILPWRVYCSWLVSRSLFYCLNSWRYNPLWLYFHSPVAGFSLLVFEVSWSHTTTQHSR